MQSLDWHAAARGLQWRLDRQIQRMERTDMESQYTAGPWIQDPVDDTILICDTHQQVLAIVQPEWDQPGRTLAVASLIYAAPDLLDACRQMLANAIDAETTTDCDGEEYADIQAAREAIAKAEGVQL